jgi:hypothetical protein
MLISQKKRKATVHVLPISLSRQRSDLEMGPSTVDGLGLGREELSFKQEWRLTWTRHTGSRPPPY